LIATKKDQITDFEQKSKLMLMSFHLCSMKSKF